MTTLDVWTMRARVWKDLWDMVVVMMVIRTKGQLDQRYFGYTEENHQGVQKVWERGKQ